MSQSIHVAIVGKIEFIPRIHVNCFQMKGQIHEADVPAFALLDNFFPKILLELGGSGPRSFHQGPPGHQNDNQFRMVSLAQGHHLIQQSPVHF